VLYFESATTPTISIVNRGSPGGESISKNSPIDDRLGRYWRANVSLTIATRGEPTRSRASKARPARSGVCSVSKNVGPTWLKLQKRS
jgi:hypothetical protein